MIFLSFLTGIVTTVIGALPPGASNLAVIKTTLQVNRKESLKLSYGAGVGEVVLSFIALFFGMAAQDFFKMNVWMQYMVALIITLAGIYFILHKKKSKEAATKKTRSSYLLGFTLSIINPPVLIYWVFVFSILGSFVEESSYRSILWVTVFLTGVFLGKFLTLYGYSKLGLHIKKRNPSKNENLNNYIGLTLIGLGFLQMGKLIFF